MANSMPNFKKILRALVIQEKIVTTIQTTTDNSRSNLNVS